MKLLGVISAAQLGMGLVGVRKACATEPNLTLVSRWLAGNHETRSLVHGTNLSAPAWMLLAKRWQRSY